MNKLMIANTVILVSALCFFFVVLIKLLNGWPREKDKRYILGRVDGKVVKLAVQDLLMNPCSCGAQWSLVPNITHRVADAEDAIKCHEEYMRRFGVELTKEEMGRAPEGQPWQRTDSSGM